MPNPAGNSRCIHTRALLEEQSDAERIRVSARTNGDQEMVAVLDLQLLQASGELDERIRSLYADHQSLQFDPVET